MPRVVTSTVNIFSLSSEYLSIIMIIIIIIKIIIYKLYAPVFNQSIKQIKDYELQSTDNHWP